MPHFCGLRKLAHSRLLQSLKLVSTHSVKHKTLGEENAIGLQDMTLRGWAEPKDLLVQTFVEVVPAGEQSGPQRKEHLDCEADLGKFP